MATITLEERFPQEIFTYNGRLFITSEAKTALTLKIENLLGATFMIKIRGTSEEGSFNAFIGGVVATATTFTNTDIFFEGSKDTEVIPALDVFNAPTIAVAAGDVTLTIPYVTSASSTGTLIEYEVTLINVEDFVSADKIIFGYTPAS